MADACELGTPTQDAKICLSCILAISSIWAPFIAAAVALAAAR